MFEEKRLYGPEANAAAITRIRYEYQFERTQIPEHIVRDVARDEVQRFLQKGELHPLDLKLELFLLQRLKLPINFAAMSLSLLMSVVSLLAAAYVLLIPFGVAFAFTLYNHKILRRAERLLKERLLGTGHSRPRI
jgi:pilus assembly protein TadC